MPVVVIANPKGGVGKSTLSTQVAGYFASKGHATMLGDTKRAPLRFKLQVQQHEAIWIT